MQELERDRFILIIDPHREHAQLVQQVLAQSSGDDAWRVQASQAEYRSQNRFDIIEDGNEAIDYLLQRNQYTQAPRPDLVLLDLDLPGHDGHSILTTIKTTPHLKRIPVIVFTQSDHSEDVLRSYASQGNCYVVKAADLAQLSHTVQQIESFWLGIVTLPLR
ncbi:response regulator [Nodosilinea sp. E11]|uniref:response regulator n=1 Tax=Nodosilinea sp. E11 TaxID=3037479 RepID=UPI002934AB41|nr:response regulator [Nodosilinea sp. E11]WOD40851.1 response regulator [Nodosilinea sp. E11]